jgi:predicted transcriptional regulator
MNQDAKRNFRLDRAMDEALEQLAAERKMSVSELIRDAVLEKVERLGAKLPR